jgi:hypothetical protein
MLSVYVEQMGTLDTSSSPSNSMSLHVFGLAEEWPSDVSRVLDSREVRAFFAVETPLSVVFNAVGPSTVGSMVSDLRFVGMFENRASGWGKKRKSWGAKSRGAGINSLISRVCVVLLTRQVNTLEMPSMVAISDATPEQRLPSYEGSTQFRNWRYSVEQLAHIRATLNEAAVATIRNTFETDQVLTVNRTQFNAQPSHSQGPLRTWLS